MTAEPRAKPGCTVRVAVALSLAGANAPVPDARVSRRATSIALSDGTGNSAAKLQKTNVWRIYEALDLTAGDQVALYDDGVGTASFKPIAVLGGAFGYGLKRNVLDLYMFLCRTYRADPDDPASHDRIFAFGFSRGAYTARVLAALVASVGLMQADSEAERPPAVAVGLSALSRRSLSALVAGAARPPAARRRPARLGCRVRGKPAFDPARTVKADIEFLGVWDTVAAYGLPVDELTRGWERWVWPMLPKDRRVSARVRRACHALALDDERQTFFPLLWTEHEEPQNACVHARRPGANHAGVVRRHALQRRRRLSRRQPGARAPGVDGRARPASAACGSGRRCAAPDGRIPRDWVDRAVVTAPMHDSRRGLGGYYRYHPRPRRAALPRRPRRRPRAPARRSTRACSSAFARMSTATRRSCFPNATRWSRPSGRILDDEDARRRPRRRQPLRAPDPAPCAPVAAGAGAQCRVVAPRGVLPDGRGDAGAAARSRCARRAITSPGSGAPQATLASLVGHARLGAAGLARAAGCSTTSSGPSSCLPASASSSR